MLIKAIQTGKETWPFQSRKKKKEIGESAEITDVLRFQARCVGARSSDVDACSYFINESTDI